MKKIIYPLFFIGMVFFATSCGSKKDDPKPSDNSNQGSNNSSSYNSSTDLYWDATIDGTQKVFVRSATGYLNGASVSGWNQYGSTYGKYKIGAGGLTLENDNSAVIFNLNEDPSESDYNSFFTSGSKNYVLTEDGLNGVYIYWIDPNGTYWSTYGGSQSGSSFSITKISSTVENGMPLKVVEATFSCKLYNGASSKTITNGKFRGLISLYQEN